MGLHEAKRFLAYLDSDPVLQSRLTKAAWNARTAVELGAARGYHFDAAHLKSAISEAWGELSEDELRNMSGGGDGEPVSGPNSTNSSHWSPPPGDVSGRSCFFGGKK